MRFADKIAGRKDGSPYFSFEFFPPRTEEGFDNLLPRISRLSSLKPIAISITWGAGGSTKERSLELAGLTQAREGTDTILHLTCTNMVEGMVDDVLQAAKQQGVQNILALRGDPPRGEEAWIPADPKFTSALDLIRYIRASPLFKDQFCIGVAAYPDGHPDKERDEEAELNLLKEKVDAGAEFIITQLFYDVDRFLGWVKRVRAKGILVPIIPGIMPIQTYSSFERLVKLCGTKVPPTLTAALDPIRTDDQKVKEFGITLAIEMITRITTESDIRGIHFCTLNLERSIQMVLEKLQWAGGNPVVHNSLIPEAPSSISFPPPLDTNASLATSASEAIPTAFVSEIETQAGPGEPKDAAGWDDFPNGRFGDYKSPAFGNQGPWGGLGIARSEALAQWGHPKSEKDLTQIFLRHLHGEILTTPFSAGPLSPESLLILTHLENMSLRGWWTVGSQPAVNGGKSEDEVVGWGPRGGYVFQKAFVEFFADEKDVKNIEQKIKSQGGGWVDYFAGNLKGDFKSNMAEGGRNAVTWGVFPGQEIAQSTIIEKPSFLAWKEEAFSIWAEWASFYRPGTGERILLEAVCHDRWLVSIVHHDFQDPEGLWTFLLA